MKRLLLLFACTLVTLQAQDWAKQNLEKSPRHREWVTVKAGSDSVNTLVVYPESKTKTPVVVLIHEIFGMTDWVQDMADQIAAKGYIVVAPDLLSPQHKGEKMDQSEAIQAVSHLDPEAITRDLNAVADYGVKLPASDGKLFVTGFCWGGGQSFRFATNRNDLKAAFVFYGPPPDKEAMARIQGPVYGFYAGNDARIDATIPRTTKDMKQLNKTYEPVVYEGAGHGFMRAGEAPDATEANRKARTEAFERLTKLLQ